MEEWLSRAIEYNDRQCITFRYFLEGQNECNNIVHMYKSNFKHA
jgi:hypothetical protein